jgi:hypothetical protein
LNAFKEKQTTDFHQYKSKLEGMINSINTQIEQSEKGSKNFTTKMLETTEVNMRNEIDMLNKRLSDMRLENHKYAFDLQKKSSELNVEHEKILTIKQDILNSLDNTVIKMDNMHKDTVKEFEDYKTDFRKIQNKFVELSEFIKDIRFKKNAHLDVERREIKAFANKLAFQETGVRSDKRSSTIQHKHITINDIDKDKNEGDESPVRGYYDDIKRDEIFSNLDRQIEPVIYETEDVHEETNPDEIKRTKFGTAKELYAVDPKTREVDMGRASLTGSKFLSKYPDSSRRQDTTGTRERDSPVRYSAVNTAEMLNPLAVNNIKYEVTKKTTELEKRIIEVEHNAKKKLEELTAQLKIFIPSINFNPYVKRNEKNDKLDKLPQLNVENLIYHNNAGQNFSLNIMDPSSLINTTVYSNPGTRKFMPTTHSKKQSNAQLTGNNINKEYYTNINILNQAKGNTDTKPPQASKNIK